MHNKRSNHRITELQLPSAFLSLGMPERKRGT